MGRNGTKNNVSHDIKSHSHLCPSPYCCPSSYCCPSFRNGQNTTPITLPFTFPHIFFPLPHRVHPLTISSSSYYPFHFDSLPLPVDLHLIYSFNYLSLTYPTLFPSLIVFPLTAFPFSLPVLIYVPFFISVVLSFLFFILFFFFSYLFYAVTNSRFFLV